MAEKENDEIHYQEYDENIDITSVVIPNKQEVSPIFL